MEGDPKLTKENSKNAKKNKRNSVRWGVETRITLGLKSLQLIWIGQVFIIETQSESNSSQRKWDFFIKTTTPSWSDVTNSVKLKWMRLSNHVRP